MANITVLEALQLSLNATKKYVDENNQLYWMEPYEITGTKTKLANVDISTLTKNRLYTFNYKKYSEIDKVGIKKIYDDGTKKSITTLSQGLEYIYFSDLSSIGFTMYIKYSHGTSSKITGTFGSTASEYTSTLTPMVLDTQSNKEFIPTKEYDPTTKKYVDDSISNINDLPLLSSICMKNEDGSLIKSGVNYLLDFSKIPVDDTKFYLDDVSSTGKVFSNAILGFEKDGVVDTNLRFRLNSNFPIISLGYRTSDTSIYISNRFSTISYIINSNKRTVSELYSLSEKVNKSQVITISNKTEYTPTDDYHPATKKYVDDKVAGVNASTITGLATVATSGSYNDLTNKPIIPSIDGLATETYVNNKVAGLVDSAPEALNTLNELATALGNDANFATTISNQIGLKANSADLATVATSGSYNDLSDKPTIPAAYTHPASHPANMITGLHTVATSGDYNDLTNRPIKVLPDDTTVADLYNLEMGIYLLTNNIEFNITDDTNMENGVVFNKFSPFTPILYRGNGMVGDLSSNIYYVFTSDGSLISAGTTDNSWAGTIATVATTGSYNDLTDKPTIPTAYTHPATHPASMITGLSTVATSGSYADLTNKPTIPTVTNDLTNTLKANYDTAYTHSQSAHAPSNAEANVQADWNVTDTGSDAYIKNKPTIPAAYTHPTSHPASMITGLATVATSGSYNDLSNKPTIPTSLPANGGNADTVGGYTIWVGTQAQYNAISSKSSTTIYLIKEG